MDFSAIVPYGQLGKTVSCWLKGLLIRSGLVFGITRWQTRTLSVSLALAMTLSLWGCGGSPSPSSAPMKPETRVAAAKSKPAKLSGKISEASPPEVIQQLREEMEKYQPQVAIASPKPNELFQDNTVSVQLTVKDLLLFKDAKLGLGPHLHIFLDDQPYQAVYDVSQPLVLKDLAPGTHTLRVFAGRPWHESFKNEGAYAQTTFHVFTKTPNNDPNPGLPLLTYSRPQGVYGAEPIMLDFYLTNAPLHLVAQEDAKDEISDWRIRVTVNGDRFDLDRWQPIYLKGFKPGKNWVQLEYIDEKGQSIQNVFNNTARIFTYQPNGQDTLAKLTRGEISLAEARAIVDPNYKPGVIEAPKLEVIPSPVPVAPIPEVKEEAPKVEEKVPETVPAPVETPEVKEPEAKEEVKEAPKGGFFNRFKPSKAPSIVPIPAPVPVEKPAEAPEETKEPEVKETPEVEEAPATPEVKEAPKGGFFNRFKPSAKPSPEAIAPVIEEPKAPEVVTPKVEETPEVKEEIKEPEVVTPKVEETPEAKEEVKTPPKGGFFDRFKRSAPKPSSEPIPSEAPVVEPEEVKEPEVGTPNVEEAPEVKETPKVPFYKQFQRSAPKPAPATVPSEAPAVIEEELKAPEEPEVIVPEVKETPAPAVKEAPKVPFYKQFQRPSAAPKIAPIVPSSPIPSELAEPEEPEKVEVEEKPESSEVVVPTAKPTPKVPFYKQFQRTTQPTLSPVPIPSELTEPEEEKPLEAPKTPEAETTPKVPFFDRFQRSTPKPSPEPVLEKVAEPEEQPEVVESEAKETPKVPFFEQFQRSTPKPSPEPVLEKVVEPEEEPDTSEVKEAPKVPFYKQFQRSNIGKPTAPPAPSIEMIEPPSVQDKSEEPEIEVTPTPKPDFFKRFQHPEVKEAPSIVPDRLSVPEEAVEEPKILEPETPKPEAKETPKENPFDRFRRSVAKPPEPPKAEEPKEVEPPKPSFQAPKSKPTEAKSEETPDFDPRSDLERRLGVPIKPPIAAPEKPVVPKPASETPKPSVKFEVPKSSSELFKRKNTNPFLKSSEPVETPAD